MTFDNQIIIPNGGKHIGLSGDNITFRPVKDRSYKFIQTVANTPKYEQTIKTLDEARGDEKRAQQISQIGGEIINGINAFTKDFSKMKGMMSQFGNSGYGMQSNNQWMQNMNNIVDIPEQNPNFNFDFDFNSLA